MSQAVAADSKRQATTKAGEAFLRANDSRLSETSVNLHLREPASAAGIVGSTPLVPALDRKPGNCARAVGDSYRQPRPPLHGKPDTFEKVWCR